MKPEKSRGVIRKYVEDSILDIKRRREGVVWLLAFLSCWLKEFSHKQKEKKEYIFYFSHKYRDHHLMAVCGNLCVNVFTDKLLPLPDEIDIFFFFSLHCFRSIKKAQTLMGHKEPSLRIKF